MAPKKSGRLQRGGAFLTGLAVVTVLTLIVVGAAARIGTESRSQRARLEAMRADRMAEAGLARALAALQTHDPNAATTTTDEWAELGQAGEEEFTVGNGSFRVQIVDAGAFVNLNTAPEEHLLELPLTQEQVDALLDWREPGQFPRVQGAKDEYYNNLDRPYNAALKRLSTFGELLAVRGFDGPTLYEPPTAERARALTTGAQENQLSLSELAGVDSVSANVGPDGQQRLNANQAPAAAMTQRGIRQQAATAIVQRRNTQGTFTTLGDVLRTPGLNADDQAAILDNLTIGTGATLTGRINLNTASTEVLRSVPDLPDEAADDIVSRRGTFASLGELASISGVTPTILPELADAFTVNTSLFRIRVMGIRGAQRSYLEAIVQFVEGAPKLLYRESPPFADMDVRWGWSAEAATTTELVEPE